ncbi:lipid-A-disaccharide synthase [Marinicella gelatinilytica]|uniref:lipid-A-disaccharide synthase n=1 Tax=Marinicella gelatinilytica TaxID=2996017 RepID=UPI0022608430|nr:lipid-A-disaccharide synthase [Marinicella gelatinilytica]MCX7544314.1 lipid-A-disaccharide synthase [Marinicella gelatinilytica]
MSKKSKTIAVVAGEASGELLAVDLIKQLKLLQPEIRILVVGGAKLSALDVELIADNEIFQVMGLVEIVADLPALLKAKNQLVKTLLDRQVDLYIGVDAPELNFAIAKKLHKQQVPVMHYVSPSVWAWRPKRVYKMARYIDYLLTLFPFEPALYADTTIKTFFVGHPMAQQIPIEVNKSQQKAIIGLEPECFTLALLPGSRSREINTLMPLFAAAANQLANSDWQLISSAVSPEKQKTANQIAKQYGLKIHWFDDSQAVLKAADFAIVGSGTVALEAMLCKTPMVVAYKIAAMSYGIVRLFKLMKLPYYSLPNVLHGDFLVPEVMQNDLTVPQLVLTTQQSLQSNRRLSVVAEFTRLHRQLLPPENQQAGQIVSDIMEAL